MEHDRAIGVKVVDVDALAGLNDARVLLEVEPADVGKQHAASRVVRIGHCLGV